MAFDYHYTCPEIDKNISYAKGSIEDTISNLVEECCPLLEGDPKQRFVKGWADSLYDSLENIFEDVRETNVKIRAEAERQINYLEDDINDRDIKISELEETITNLEQELCTK